MMNMNGSNPQMSEGKTDLSATPAAATFVQAAVASATIPSHLEYFGYMHSAYGQQNEVVDRTNLSVIDWSDYPSYSQLYLDLSVIRAKGNKAVVTTPVLYTPKVNGIQLHNLRSDAQAQWNIFMNRLVTDGFFNVANPKSGTVIGFYPVDEPDPKKDMADVNGAPSPKLVQILNIIKSNSSSQNAPLATCASIDYVSVIAGLKLFNWIGLDVYGDNDNAYVGKFNQLQSLLQLRSDQRMILVPQAAVFYKKGTFQVEDAVCNDPNRMLFVAQTNASVMAIIPFIWNSVDNVAEKYDGLRSGNTVLQDVRQQYDQMGKQVKFARANAAYVGQRIPGQMVAGRPCDIRVDMRNTGNVAWEPGGVYLGTQNPHDNTIWGSHRVAIPSRIEPGQIAEITFTVMAPSIPGYYNMQGRMVAEEITWFGDWTPNVLVNVFAG